MELWELTARESIRDLVARYNANADSGRFDDVLALFAAGAAVMIPGRTATGADEIRSIFTATSERDVPGPIRHHTSTLQIDLVDEVTATGRCYFAVLTANGLDHWGRYVDAYAEVAGRWLFTERRVSVDAYSPVSAFGPETIDP